MITNVLIANRGEIGLRVARACRELGLQVSAVYSTVDRDSALVEYADHAVHIGPAASRRSYLNVPALIEAARRCGADAIHPGYGFLSEDQDFAEICADEGFTFVGPAPEVMRRVSDKSVARGVMADAGLPLLPGSISPVRTAAAGTALADEFGYPVIIKAVAGGGGRGMVVVQRPADFAAAYAKTRSDALALFGCSDVYVERYLPHARHIEVQVLCDNAGRGIHLGERDCSIQRRHQKLLEESPCSRFDDDQRARIGELAVTGALAAGLTGAGTMEFLLDESGAAYFMELNARIQVEHPVTEMVTGIDLVREQLLISSGAGLTHRQSDVTLRGAAIECRINAEDPARQFLPTAGPLTRFVLPGGPWTRVDTGYRERHRVDASYDSLLAKVIVWAPDRRQASARMARALAEMNVDGAGLSSTLGLHRNLLRSEAFRTGDYDTAYLENNLAELVCPPPAALPPPRGELRPLSLRPTPVSSVSPVSPVRPRSSTRSKGASAMTTSTRFGVPDLMELLTLKAGLSRADHTDNPDATLESVGLDSLAFLAIQTGLHERYGFQLPSEGPNYDSTVGEIANAIDARLLLSDAVQEMVGRIGVDRLSDAVQAS